MADRSAMQGPQPGTVTITLGADGRVYWHQLTSPVLELALMLSPQDAGLRDRLPAARTEKKRRHDHDADSA
jgi:hypothetical protein